MGLIEMLALSVVWPFSLLIMAVYARNLGRIDIASNRWYGRRRSNGKYNEKGASIMKWHFEEDRT